MSETAPRYESKRSRSGGDELTGQTGHTPRGRDKVPRKRLVDRVKELMDHRGISQANLAEETGLSRSVVSSWLAGKYEHQGDVIPAMKAWVERVTHGEDDWQFVELHNSKLVFEACRFAIAKRKIALLVGRPGLGKTVALKEFHRRQLLNGEEVLYHYCSPAIKQHSLVKMLARRFGLSERGTPFDLLEAVVGYLRRKPSPLIFDEANHLNVPCLDALRYLNDQVGVPIVLCGSIQLQRTLSDAGDRNMELEQLQSRIGIRILLKELDLQGSKKVLERHFGELHPDTVRAFHIASKGVVRDLVNGIDSAKEIMRINNTDVLDGEVIKSAFARQFIN